jgi:peptidoglycan/LPS O-acetylase OafA/YrhL
MWAPPTARTSDHHRLSSDAATLAEDDDDELSLSAEELAQQDPLDAKHVVTKLPPTSRVAALAARWAKLLQRLRLRLPPPPPTASLGEHRMDAVLPQSGHSSLLNTDWSTRLSTEARPTPWLIWPLPSWSHRFFRYPMPEEPKRATDYLDGLRGVAALFVVFFHFLLGGFEGAVFFAFGRHNMWNVISLPFFRTAFAGEAMVAVFFVISGYVLSARCIIAFRAGNQEKVNTALTSMAFRRPIRLFAPSIVGSGIALVLTFLGVIPSHQPGNWTPRGELACYRQYLMTWLLDIWDWGDARTKSQRQGTYNWYGAQLWTIPLEFDCSMVLFMLILATARCTVRARLATLTALLVGLHYTLRWDVALFVAGMGLAELNIIVAERNKARTEPRRAWIRKLRQLVPWTTLLLGWYLTGLPTGGGGNQKPYGYGFLLVRWDAHFRREYIRIWVGFAAMLLVGSLSFLPTAQRAFTTPVARYLGKVSYAFYIVHFFMQFSLRHVLWQDFHVVTNPGSITNPLGWGFLLSMLIDIPVTLWVADIFWRLVDAPTVRLAKWLEGKCFMPPKGSEVK